MQQVQTLADNHRVSVANCMYLGVGCLFYLFAFVGIAGAIASHAVHADVVIGTAVVLMLTAAVLWLALYLRYRALFVRAALDVPGGVGKHDFPRVIDASAGFANSEPELALTMVVRCLFARFWRCRVELHEGGIQIWRGPRHPEPRWQFTYDDLLQAEGATLDAVGTRFSSDEHFVRLIVDMPRMAFLLGPAWSATPSSDDLLVKLSHHGVRTFA
jgi:hypothetical protein